MVRAGKIFLIGCILYILLILIFGCYSANKAKQQFGRAANSYPEIPAQYCATVYPIKEKIIKGKDSIQVDTVWGAGEILYDTVFNFDTVRIKITERLPGKIITQTLTRVDTIIKEDRAAVALCEINNTKLVVLATDKTREAAKWKGRAIKHGWILAGMSALLLLTLFFKAKKLFTK